MQRTQVLMEEWQLEALRSSSARQGESVSSLIRKLVTDWVAELKSEGSIDDIAGIARGRKNAGKHHDAVLYRKRRRSSK